MTNEQTQLRQKWLEALRSGEYQQTKHKLFDGVGYCCLGVLCKVAGLEPVLKDGEYYFSGNSEHLSDFLTTEIGLKSARGDFNNFILYNAKAASSLTSLNDAGMSFTKIADFIEANAADLFEGTDNDPR